MNMGKWSDKWIIHPFPNMSEPEKAACYSPISRDTMKTTLLGSTTRQAFMHRQVLYADTAQIVSIGKAIANPSSAGRKWFGYSAYNPAIIIKLLDIFRVFYNYVEVGKTGKRQL